ncbi:Response regulator receiver protein (fragment) [Verrucomicrobia bacterium]
MVPRLVKNVSPAWLGASQAHEKAAFLPEADGAQSGTSVDSQAGKGRKILVVDDNPIVLKAFEMRLKRDGFFVSTLKDATAVASIAAQDQVELIILDVCFPPGPEMVWDGFSVLQWLKRFPELSAIPVIMISSNGAQYKEKAQQAGAVAFFEKPVDYQALLAVIQQVLH